MYYIKYDNTTGYWNVHTPNGDIMAPYNTYLEARERLLRRRRWMAANPDRDWR